MRKLRVLVACEESQVVASEFRLFGHEAFSCDLVSCSGGHPEFHIMSDCLPLLNGHCYFITENGDYHLIPSKWDLIIAHPPCTYMSKAGARWMYPSAGNLSVDRYRLSQAAKAFFMEFLRCDCDHVAIENPVPLKVVGLPSSTQAVQPYEFGDPYSKKTLLWIKGLPNLQPTLILDKHTPWMPSNTSGFSHGKGGSRGVAHDKKTASRTFSGIARAMAAQWIPFICKELSMLNKI